MSNPKGKADPRNHVARLPKTIGEEVLWRVVSGVRDILLLTHTLEESESAPLLDELGRIERVLGGAHTVAEVEAGDGPDEMWSRQSADRNFILAMREYVMARPSEGYEPEWSKGLSTNGLN